MRPVLIPLCASVRRPTNSFAVYATCIAALTASVVIPAPVFAESSTVPVADPTTKPRHSQEPAQDTTPRHSCVINAEGERTGSKHASESKLRIGVRNDARPFAYSSTEDDIWSSSAEAPLAARRYTGYVSKICDFVLSDMLLNPPEAAEGANIVPIQQSDIEVTDIQCLAKFKQCSALKDRLPKDEGDENQKDSIDVSSFQEICGDEWPLPEGYERPEGINGLIQARAAELQSNFDRVELLENDLDILCDPVTISNERRHGFTVSPPIFLSGIGLVNKKGAKKEDGRCPSKPLIGFVRGTNAHPTGLLKIIENEELKRYKSDLIKAVKDPFYRCSRGLNTQPILRSYDNHKEASEAFCGGDFIYYLGDREIISASAQNIVGCEVDNAGVSYSQDRYAIFGKIRYGNKDHTRWASRFFDILAQKIVIGPSALDRAMLSSFPKTKRTPDLERFLEDIRGRPED